MNTTTNLNVSRQLITKNPPRVKTVDLLANIRAWRERSGNSSPDRRYCDFASMLLPVHGTSIARFEQIVRSGMLKSFARLESESHAVAGQRLMNATDALDIALGLHEYAFLNIGRVNPLDLQEVYLCFPAELSSAPGALVGLREIVHFGGLVSVEAANFYAGATRDRSLNVAKRNLEAARKFFGQVYSGADFIGEVFPSFLQIHFPAMVQYLLRIAFPGTKLNLMRYRNEMTLLNAWEGPQLMMPDSVVLADYLPLVLVTSYEESVQRRVRLSGFPPSRIYQMADVLPLANIFGESEGQKMLNFATCVNQALANLMPRISPGKDLRRLDFLSDGFWPRVSAEC